MQLARLATERLEVRLLLRLLHVEVAGETGGVVLPERPRAPRAWRSHPSSRSTNASSYRTSWTESESECGTRRSTHPCALFDEPSRRSTLMRTMRICRRGCRTAEVMDSRASRPESTRVSSHHRRWEGNGDAHLGRRVSLWSSVFRNQRNRLARRSWTRSDPSEK